MFHAASSVFSKHLHSCNYVALVFPLTDAVFGMNTKHTPASRPIFKVGFPFLVWLIA